MAGTPTARFSLADLERDGFAVVPSVIPESHVAALIDAVESFEASHAAVREKGGSTYAVRRLCELIRAVRELSASPAIRELIEPALGPSARVVRSILFDKNPAANWKVPWHQDLTIAVKQRHEVARFGPWSTKAGVTHVQPPTDVLERMLTIRLHLDDCGPENGPLRVIAGSHALGTIDVSAIPEIRRTRPEVTCTVPAGGAVLMRPLLLHASSPAQRPGHRRVIHLEFAAGELPGELEWHESAPSFTE
jgi:ectoine hydroxylase-related dioxygenase (phytanoyl-CoA dioxygenase family)